MSPDAICSELRRRGYYVVWKETTDDQLVIAIDFMRNPETPWVRAFHLDKAVCDPNMFEGAINAWKAEVRRNHYLGLDSEVVRSVTARFGVKRFESAMRERSLDAAH